MKQPQPAQISAPTAYPSPAQAAPQGGGQHMPPAVPAPMMPQPTPMVTPAAPSPMPPNGGQAYAQHPQAQPMPGGGQLPMPGQAMPAQPITPQSGAPMPGQMPPVQNMAPAPGMVHSSPIAAPVAEDAKEGGETALPRIAIHAFCERSETAGTVQATTQDWRMARANVKVYMGGLQAAIEYYHKENTPGLILFESGMRGPELFAQLEQLASVCDNGTKVVMIGAANDIRLYRELMDKGLSDYIVPPFHPLTLIRSLGDLYSDPEQPYIGRVVAFFGAKGGVGSSTLAHNVAWGMANMMKQETALVDLDSSWGTTGLDFNYDSTEGLEDALSDPDRLDATLLDRIMVRHTDKLSILPAAASLGTPTSFDPESYEALVNGVRALSPLTILDMPHIWSKWSSNLLTSADDVVITATPDLANLRNTKNLIDFLKAARPNDADPLLVLNKTGVPKTAEIPVKDFASAVGINPSLVLAYEPIAYTEASNDGKMLSDVKAAAPAFEGLMYLAQRLRTGEFPAPVTVKRGRKQKKRKPQKKAASGQQEAGQTKSSKSLFAKLKKRK